MAFDNLKLEKGLYTTGKSFTQALESIDPSENYIGTEYEGLDAYQRQLKRFDIKVSGTGSDTVSKFFATTDSAALFPEYVSRAVRQGIQEKSILDKIIATTTNVDSMDYRAITTATDKSELELANVAEGAKIPETIIKTKDSLTKLHKRGRMLVASYEAIKFQKLDLFTITLKQIGSYIANCQANDAIQALMDFDVEGYEVTEGAITYDDLINFWSMFDPYKLTTMVGNAASVGNLLKLPELRDSAAGLNFHGTGNMITPMGAEIVTLNSLPMANGFIGIDNTCALEKVQVGDVATDFDKLIDRQLERATITTIAGFSRIFDGAIKAIGVVE